MFSLSILYMIRVGMIFISTIINENQVFYPADSGIGAKDNNLKNELDSYIRKKSYSKPYSEQQYLYCI